MQMRCIRHLGYKRHRFLRNLPFVPDIVLLAALDCQGMPTIALSLAKFLWAAMPPWSSVASHRATMRAPFLNTKCGRTLQFGSLRSQDGNLLLPPMNGRRLMLPKLRVKNYNVITVFLAIVDIVRISDQAGLNDTFAHEAGSVDLEEPVAFFLSEIVMLAIKHDRGPPNRKRSCLILCLQIVFFQGWDTPVIVSFLE